MAYYETLPYLPLLDYADMDDAAHLTFRPRFAGDAYENQAGYASSDPAAGNHPVFSFTAVAGALYTVTSDSYDDPYNLVLYDDDGYPIAEDDGWGAIGQDGLAFIAPYSGTYYVDASWHQGGWAPYSDVSLDILEDLDTIGVQVGAGTAAADAITGTSAHDALYGYGGDDLLYGGGGDDMLDGGSGVDTVQYDGKLADYDVDVFGHRLTVTDYVGLDGVDTLVDVERVEFADLGVAFDTEGAAGQAYRLYQAAFDRAPDLPGLGLWIAQLDRGMSLGTVANYFVASPEFQALYGTRIDYATFVTGLYENVLHRAPDAAGFAHWMDRLTSGSDTPAAVLVGFSESAENYAQLIGTMEHGMVYQPLV
ncbi:uncharacterized protein DUF4214 [Pseudoduganella flava]|uniref:DUF4214 domain-containing protein n=1 Tax=Pseudoduganella flava TaxID=871742 RepID=A0A562Q0H4_9BURK|nr:DUF4214 domain-containing protein [Pseudoduganella flava]QGZ38604.1 DUF4214 domain-containing protein [Pseudoduganella flava]TWI49826.1 uncharacterized protein DUF4214 [Pseudoduganella flava]